MSISHISSTIDVSYLQDIAGLPWQQCTYILPLRNYPVELFFNNNNDNNNNNNNNNEFKEGCLQR